MKYLYILFFIFFLTGIAYSLSIDVSINQNLTGELKYLEYNETNNLVEFKTEFFNKGSISYTARIRFDVLDENEKIFTGWSKEGIFYPGNTNDFEVNWVADRTGNFTVVPRLYYANEIIALDNITIQINEITEKQDVFEIENLKVYENHITFDLKSNKTSENIKIIPKKYIPGWIIEQEKISLLDKDKTKKIQIFYKPTVFSSRDIDIDIVSNNGEHYSEKTLSMKKEKDSLSLFRKLLISYFFFKILD